MGKATPEQQQALGELSPDCSLLLTHLVRQDDGKTDEKAREDLRSILGLLRGTGPVLRASYTGWYGSDSVTPRVFSPEKGRLLEGSEYDKRPLRCVCFTESTLAGLKAHCHVFKAQYGLAFDRAFLFGKGANPRFNIREELLKKEIKSGYDQYYRRVFNFIPVDLHPYVNIINAAFDATHEREWRHVGDLKFHLQDVKYVFCPKAEFEEFRAWFQGDSVPKLVDLGSLDDP